MSDIFISYRRAGGDDLAHLLYHRLSNDGYDVFLDVACLGQGKFNEALYTEIARCKDFILVLSPGALDACDDPEDWVRKEIEFAQKLKKRIIPVMKRSFEFPQCLPESLSDLKSYQRITVDGEYLDAFYEKIKNLHLSSPQCKKKKRSANSIKKRLNWEPGGEDWEFNQIQCQICRGQMYSSGPQLQLHKGISIGIEILYRWFSGLSTIYFSILALGYYFRGLDPLMLELVGEFPGIGKWLCFDTHGFSVDLLTKHAGRMMVFLLASAVIVALIKKTLAWRYRKIIQKGSFSVEYICDECGTKQTVEYSSDVLIRWYKIPVSKGEAVLTTLIAIVVVPIIGMVGLPFLIVPILCASVMYLFCFVTIGVVYLFDIAKTKDMDVAGSKAKLAAKDLVKEVKYTFKEYCEDIIKIII